MNTILIVDDSFLNRVMMMELLDKNIDNLNFLEAENGNEALDILHEKEIDLMILDLHMPVMDGYEVLKRINADDTLQNTPTIVNSSETDYQKMAYALSLGAKDFFTKTEATQDMSVIISTKVRNIIEYSHKVNDIFMLNNLMQHDMKMSSIIQKSFIEDMQKSKNINIFVDYRPLQTLSGNIVSFIDLQDRTYFLMVDMKSSAVSSVLSAMLFRELFIKKAPTCESASKLMQEINDELMSLLEDTSEQVVFSAMIAQIDKTGLSVCNAGFTTTPYIFYAGGAGVEKVLSSGKMVGMHKGAKYGLVRYDFSESDAVIFYTDGLFSRDGIVAPDVVDIHFEKIYSELKDKQTFDLQEATNLVYDEFIGEGVELKEDLTIATVQRTF